MRSKASDEKLTGLFLDMLAAEQGARLLGVAGLLVLMTVPAQHVPDVLVARARGGGRAR